MLSIKLLRFLPLLIISTISSPVFGQEVSQRKPLTPFTGGNEGTTSPLGATDANVPNLSVSRGNNLSEQFPYTLDAGDVVALNIFNVPEYSKEYQVLVDGSINLPLINRVSVAGLTLVQAEQIIVEEYVRRGLLRSPIISLDLVRPRPITVALVGEIRTPGSFSVPFDGGTGNNQNQATKFPRLISALKLADGINASADTRNIRVVRNFQGQDYTINVSLWDFLEKGDLTQNVVLRDGDRIFIPSVKEINSAEVLRVASANFSANLSIPITISIVGEVNRPGPYTLTGDDVRANQLNDNLTFQNNSVIRDQQSLAGIPTTTRAIKTAGGLTAKADLRNVQVRRTLPSGEEQVIAVNLWELLQTGRFRDDALLQNGDRIFIPALESIDDTEARQIAVASFSPNSINVSVVGEVREPGLKQLSPNVSLQQALLQAGGFNNRRAQEAVAKIIRLNPNGTVSEKVVRVNFGAPLNEENNPPLLNNDIVFVERSGLAVASDLVFSSLNPFNQVLDTINLTTTIMDRLNWLD